MTKGAINGYSKNACEGSLRDIRLYILGDFQMEKWRRLCAAPGHDKHEMLVIRPQQ